ncbi:MAG TPA: tRNA (adenosine(37)-N6)-threonylcarbamoyltransferase complex dimerization subunit type 1 TsaB [Candidatus Polarisedimenticolia bacterium]|jgi:tRNA threonylcarbamoyladenosine biosynthesis protein TsaB|nr:tRNA (adenosine(37)-N6)-threonylcarbamoyltransferase complex dimerization subunit type 1 TsaB [Candidatus Polarisedimenticolia bacterium]
MTILGIDTATRRASVALARGGEVAALAHLDGRHGHAGDLLTRLDALLTGAGLKPSDLAAIAVTIGPGSFTGVRIGMATAKGLAYALDVPLGGLSTLEALARAALPLAGGAPRLCAVLEAGRGEVYAALFRREGSGLCRETDDRSWRPRDLVEETRGGAILVGDAVATLRQAAREAGLEVTGIEPQPALAGALAVWGGATLHPGGAYDPGALRPNYVRPSDAEVARR